MSYPVIYKITSKEEQQAVIQAATDDNDAMRLPSHVVMKDGVIAGAYNLGTIPLCVGWHSTTVMNVRDSIIALNAATSIMNDRAPNGYFTTSPSYSPLSNYMEKIGFEAMWPTNLFYRQR